MNETDRILEKHPDLKDLLKDQMAMKRAYDVLIGKTDPESVARRHAISSLLFFTRKA